MLVQGYFRVLSFFDVSEAFELDRLNILLKPDASPKSTAPVSRAPEYAQAPTAPIVETTGTIVLPTGESLDSRIKYYWFGVACVELVTPFNCELDALPTHSYRWMNAPEVEKAAEDLLHARLDRFRPAMIKPSQKWLDEDYLIIDVQSAKGSDRVAATAAELLQNYSDPITRMVRGELVALSAGERDEVIRAGLSYYPTDLVVVGWAAALVYD
ncbi:MAG TPA: hypothetical protein VH022_03560, partial [Candidatus Acidoferrum sp.]|nr:hypothetical protein [Candidatus Acidoferrum sp.]